MSSDIDSAAIRRGIKFSFWLGLLVLIVSILGILILRYVVSYADSQSIKLTPSSITFGYILLFIGLCLSIYYLTEHFLLKKVPLENHKKLEKKFNTLFIVSLVVAIAVFGSLLSAVVFGLGAYFFYQAKQAASQQKDGVQSISVNPNVSSPIESIIPKNNSYALKSYYFGVAGMIPFLGLPFAALSFANAKKGFALLKERPEVKGADHCRIGIGLSIIGIILTILFSWMIINSMYF